MSDPKQLLSLVERLENLDQQNRDLNEERKELLLEAKSNDWDPKIVKGVVAYRRDPEAAEARSAELDKYLALLGSDGSPKKNAPAATVARLRAVPGESSRAGARATQLAASTNSPSPRQRGDEAVPRVASPSGTASPIPVSETDAVVGPASSIAEPAPTMKSRDRETGSRAGSPMLDADPFDISNQPFYRGGSTWPR